MRTFHIVTAADCRAKRWWNMAHVIEAETQEQAEREAVKAHYFAARLGWDVPIWIRSIREVS